MLAQLVRNPPAVQETLVQFLGAEYFSAFSFVYIDVFGVAFSVGWKFVIPLYCGGFSLWVGLD